MMQGLDCISLGSLELSADSPGHRLQKRWTHHSENHCLLIISPSLWERGGGSCKAVGCIGKPSGASARRLACLLPLLLTC